jgi:hypothetical protein
MSEQSRAEQAQWKIEQALEYLRHGHRPIPTRAGTKDDDTAQQAQPCHRLDHRARGLSDSPLPNKKPMRATARVFKS